MLLNHFFETFTQGLDTIALAPELSQPPNTGAQYRRLIRFFPFILGRD
jgi:hypothetical protein